VLIHKTLWRVLLAVIFGEGFVGVWALTGAAVAMKSTAGTATVNSADTVAESRDRIARIRIGLG
jgi:hypothetical protein